MTQVTEVTYMSYIKKNIKKIYILVLMLCMVFTLTGCDLPAELSASLTSNFSARAEQNTKIAERLNKAGVISDTTYKLIVESIDKNVSGIGKNITQDNESMISLLKSIVGWRIVPEPDHPEKYNDDGSVKTWTHGGGSEKEAHDARYGSKDSRCDNKHNPLQCSDRMGGYLSNYLASKKSNDGTQLLWWHIGEDKIIDTVKDNVPAVGGNGGKVEPIEVIPESLANQLKTEMSIPIYALKRTELNEHGTGLDEVMEQVKEACSIGDGSDAEELLSNYFAPVEFKDADGNIRKATLLDTEDPKQEIIRITSQTYDVGKDWDGTVFDLPTTDVETSNCGAAINFPTTQANVGNQPGIDMVVFSAGEPTIAVRLIEFNQKAIDDLENRIGLAEGRYKVINGAAYLMEYPLGYIDGFKETEDDASYDSIIKQSGLGFNLLTGKFTKYAVDADGNYTNSSVVTSDNDPYLSHSGAANALEEFQSSMVLYGETGVTGMKDSSGNDIDEELNVPFNLSLCTYGGEEVHSSVGRIVLRDYLEFTYAPDVVSGESIVALGRKLRITQLSGSKNNVVAQFYDKEGQILEGSAKLFIDDFADLDGVLTEDKVKYISKQSSAKGSITDGTPPNDTPEEDNAEQQEEVDNEEEADSVENGGSGGNNSIQSSASKIDNMALETVAQINPTSEFPGKYIAKSDVNLTDEKPLFYGMMVRASMFQTGLFSGWVQSTDSTKNSTVWWNTWLSGHGFNYSINTDNLVNFLKGNYAYDLSKENIIILDLETIAKIQQEYQAEDKLENAHALRTVFIVFGYILIAYSVILLIAWNVDINVDLGFNILEKLSFGKWVAVKDYDEIPYMDEGDTKFMRFGTLLVSCIFIISVGIILIQVNIIDFVLALIQLFGGIANYISQIFTGVYKG